jgi:hypothetical protein
MGLRFSGRRATRQVGPEPSRCRAHDAQRNIDRQLGVSLVQPSNRAVAGGGTVKFDIPHCVRAVYGRQLGIAGANGGYSYVALFYRI